MARTAFEELRVYRLAEKLADEVWDMVATWEQVAKLRPMLEELAPTLNAYLKSIGTRRPDSGN